MGIRPTSRINSDRDGKKWLIRKKAKARKRNNRRDIMKKHLDKLKNKKTWAIAAVVAVCVWVYMSWPLWSPLGV